MRASRTHRHSLLFIVAATVSVAALASSASAAEWRQFHGGAAHLGSIQTKPCSVLRTRRICSSCGPQRQVGLSGQSSPSIANGRVFVGSVGGLSAFDQASGDFLWRKAIDSSSTSPSVVNGRVFIRADGFVYAFRAWDGLRLW